MKNKTVMAFALASIAALSSCSQAKVEPQAPSSELVTVIFSCTLSDGTPFITKAGENAFLLSLTPTTALDLTITDASGKSYSTKTGKSITLPQGTYTVTHQDAKPELYQHFNADAYFSQVPLLEVNQQVSITKTTTSIELTANYASSAILFDLAEVQNIRFQTSSGNNQDLAYATGGGLGAFFLNGTITGKVCVITFYGKDDYQTAVAQVNTDGSSGAKKLEAGKYYFLRLAVPGTDSSFSFSVMDWSDGGSLL